MTFVEYLAQSQKHKLCGCQVPFITTAIFKPAPKAVKKKKEPTQENKYDKELNKGNTRVKVVSCVQPDSSASSMAYDKGTGCVTVVKFNMGPQEFKKYIKNQVLERNKIITLQMTKLRL